VNTKNFPMLTMRKRPNNSALILFLQTISHRMDIPGPEWILNRLIVVTDGRRVGVL
jgi:hypothetical protein